MNGSAHLYTILLSARSP